MKQEQNETFHLQFMQEALTQAALAANLGEVPVGAVVVIDRQIVSRGHNLVESHKDATLHAEIVALREAATKLNSWRLTEASLYVTMEPCTMCFGAIVNFRIKDLYFGCYDERHGAVGSLYNLSDSFSHIHKINIYSELMADKCRKVVQDFFKDRRG